MTSVQGVAVNLSSGSLFQWLQHVNMESMLKTVLWASACFNLNKWNGQQKALCASPVQRLDMSSMVHSVCAEDFGGLAFQFRTTCLFSVEVTLLVMLPWRWLYECCPYRLSFISEWSGVTLLRDGVCVVELSGLCQCVFSWSVTSPCLLEKSVPKPRGNFCCSPLLNDV